MNAKTCCFAGHQNLAADKLKDVKCALQKEISQAIKDGYTHFISGFEEGADLLFASIVAELAVDNAALILEAAIPYRSRMETTDALFRRLIGKCKIIGIHSEKYSQNCFIKRNRFMVSQAQRVIIVFDERLHEKSEIFSTMRYANSQKRDVRIISR